MANIFAPYLKISNMKTILSAGALKMFIALLVIFPKQTNSFINHNSGTPEQINLPFINKNHFTHNENNEIYEKREELKILTWNVYMLPYLHLLHQTPQRARLIGQLLVNLDYDIIVFQEVFHSKSRKILKSILSEKYVYQYGPFNDPNLSLFTNSGVMVVSKLPLSIVKNLVFNELRGFDKMAWKGAVLLEGEFQGKPFHLIATHMQSNIYKETRFKQLKQIYAELIHPYENKQITTIISGDLNVNSDDPEEYNKMLELTQAIDNQEQYGNYVTYDELNNSLARTITPHRRNLDYILVHNSPNPELIKRKVQIFQANYQGIKIDLSDHYALEARISYKSILNPKKEIYARKY